MNISQAIDEIIPKSPFLEEALAEGLINITALARRIKPEIEKRLFKEVKTSAVVMAISRRPSTMTLRTSRIVKEFMRELGDTIVRSDISEFTFLNSGDLSSANMRLMKAASDEKDLFCTISQGIFETTIVVSTILNDRVATIYEAERMINSKSQLCSITLRLPQRNTEVSGVYYYLLKNLAWAGLNICEIISTSNEVTFVVAESDVDRAFSILMGLKQS
jgi:hypothetical protein